MESIKLREVKKILDNTNWNYEFWKTPGSNVESACNYLDTQKFSIEKIKEFLDHAMDCETPEEIAKAIADPLAWDRISRFIYSPGNPSGAWSVDESVTFKI